LQSSIDCAQRPFHLGFDETEDRLCGLRHAERHNAFMTNIYVAVAQEERRMISERTKGGMKAARERGVVLSCPKLAEINKTSHEAAVSRAKAIAPVLAELGGLSAHAAAAELNARHVPTPTGGVPWSTKTIVRAQARLN
jgi:DNA invertase Pin-like site-specific DNA recombinase